MLVCPACGAENKPDVQVCPHCSEGEKKDSGLPSGTRLIGGRFEVIKRLGHGGMGEVYLCSDQRLGRQVALKCIYASRDDSDARARFLQEARLASRLEHLNICSVYEIYEESDRQYIVMQYVDGVSLEALQRLQQLNHRQIIDIALQVCRGMSAAHESGIIHRDLKPGNIMIDRRGTVKILDFGMAKMSQGHLFECAGETMPLTEKGIVLGTVTHMSPEQARGEQLDERSDLFSFGVVLYEMLEGRNPFRGANLVGTLQNIVCREPEYSVLLPQKLKQLLVDCLAKEKEKRIPSFAELAERLNDCLEEPAPEDRAAPTENIKHSDMAGLRLEQNQGSGSRGLGGMVYLVKRLQASTSPVSTLKPGRWKSWTALVLGAALLFLFFLKRLPEKPVPEQPPDQLALVLVQPFQVEGRAAEQGRQLAELLSFSLNQYQGLAAVMPHWFADSSAVPGGDQQARVHPVYTLAGKMTISGGQVLLKARLLEEGRAGESMEITLQGSGLESLLSHQVKTLCERVTRRILGDSPELINTNLLLEDLFGLDWNRCLLFFQAQEAYRNLNYPAAEKMLLEVDFMPPARYLLAEIAFFNGNYAQARAWIDREKDNLSAYPAHLALLFRSIDHRLRTQPDLEAALLGELVRANPYDKYYLYRLGEAHFHAGDAQGAIPSYLAALEIDPSFQPALNHLAYCYAYLGRHDQAFNYFEKYHQLDRSANSFDSFGDGYFYSGNLDTAAEFKESTLRLAPGEFNWALLTLADIQVLKTDYPAALEAAERYAASGEGDPQVLSEALGKKAWVLMVQGSWEEALEKLDLALSLYESRELHEHSREIHWLRGWVLERLGRAREAQAELDWLAGLVAEHRLGGERFSVLLKYYHHLRALLAGDSGRSQQALEELRKIMEYGPRLNYWTTYFNQSFFHCELIRELIRRQQYEQAQKEIEAAGLFNSRYPPLLWLKLILAEKTGRDTEPLRRMLREVLGAEAAGRQPPPILQI